MGKHSILSRMLMLLMLLLGGTQLTPVLADDFNSTRTDFRDESIYFVITTRFYDGDPSNNVLCWDNRQAQIASKDPCWRGDFKGLIDKLDYIKALGFTAIWITPVVQNGSGYDYHGYHAMDFSSVDLRYESRKKWGASQDVTFQSLIDAAHDKGLKIILDIVLQHTSNFGENFFCKLYERDQNIKNQANIQACMHPTDILGGEAYWDIPTNKQYDARFKYLKNTDGQNHDSKNYWHHLSTNWNWDDPSRWWGQIAGDCVDLNTENPAVTDYLVKCYGEFIKMGVDGFRIDTSGHIARLSFNAAFIPQFQALGEKYKNKRLNGCPFYMFGEVCARFGGVTYRGQPNLSPYFYTWKSDQALINEWKQYDAAWWAQQVVKEGAEPLGNMLTCLKETSLNGKTSDNAFLKNGAYHEPDYSDASGFNVIDFPMHYNFNSVGQALSMAQDGDHLYNDATFNVVYKNGHDYSPGPNDATRSNPNTADLFFMFTFRGVPCVYYGSEVDFMAGARIDPGPNGPLNQTGRAYFGQYLEGTVTATDFGKYTASGNVAQTLNSKLASYMRKLNVIRQAVPALRKGQYQVISGGDRPVFKRVYKNSEAIVDMSGSYACPSGYADVWGGTDGYHIYVKGATGQIGPAISSDGNPSFSDPGATRWYGYDDATSGASVTLNPNGGSFKTETLTVTATLSDGAKSGWYQIGNGSKVSLTVGSSKQFTIGSGMSYGQTVTVNWGATDEDGAEHTGSATYKKVDPNATITIYCKASAAPNLYVWDNSLNQLNGGWPGKMMSTTTTVDGQQFFYQTFADVESINVIFNNGSQQTADITGITEDTYFEYDGASNAKKITVNPDPTNVTVKADKATGTYYKTVTVTLTASKNDATIVYTTDGSTPTANSSKATGSKQFTFTTTTTLRAAALVDGTVKNPVSYTYTITDKEDNSLHAYFINTPGWSNVMCWAWNDSENFTGGDWPGVQCTKLTIKGDNGEDIWEWKYTGTSTGTPSGIIFNNGSGGTGNQTDDFTFTNGQYYNYNGSTSTPKSATGIGNVFFLMDRPTPVYNTIGVRVAVLQSPADISRLPRGLYIINGRKYAVK